MKIIEEINIADLVGVHTNVDKEDVDYWCNSNHKMVLVENWKQDIYSYDNKKLEIIRFSIVGNSIVEDKYCVQLGYGILLNNKLSHLIYIYEPHGYEVYPDKHLMVIYGHEDIILVWLNEQNKNKIFINIQTR